MAAEDYQVQNIYKYSRKTSNKNRRYSPENPGSPRDENIEVVETPRSDGCAMNSPGCSCDLDQDGDIANILHKKCPVISLAQQQLQRLLDETDKLLCDNSRCCRSLYDFFCICKEVLMTQNRKCQCVLLILIGVAFFLGLLLGSASCGAYLGRFNSPILSCIDSFFIPDRYSNIQETFRSIA